MVLIINTYHMGFIEIKTEEVNVYIIDLFYIYYILNFFLNNLKIVKTWQCLRQDQERHLVAAINQMSFRPLIHHLLNFHLD